MPVTPETCSTCQCVYLIPWNWTVFQCSQCLTIFDRDGSIWFPRSRAKISQ